MTMAWDCPPSGLNILKFEWRKLKTVVFLSLILDLFAFTIPLPLFPRIIEWYTLRAPTLVSQTLGGVRAVRTSLLYKPGAQSQRWDVVLLGVYCSGLQFFVSPKIRELSDKDGRKRVLLATMVGNILSALVWMKSTSFSSYLLSRVIGGLSEGNLQLAIAILSDVTTAANRSKALAHFGIEFAICFCIGPPIGAYFAASRPLPPSINSWGIELNIYAVPALITVVLLVLETIFLVVALLGAKGTKVSDKYVDRKDEAKSSKANGVSSSTSSGSSNKASPKVSVEKRISTLKALLVPVLRILDWNNTQNGKLIGSIGFISALLQGGYVRRSASKIGEGKMARQAGPNSNGRSNTALRLLQLSAVCMAFTSATVVNSLTAFASLQCDDTGGYDEVTGKPAAENPDLAKGQALGKFRSSGQLGRALGPIAACASYWTFGPSLTYSISAVAMLALYIKMKPIAATRSIQ
ncbi:major facilitator superfamily domain-containing protein [Ephemerocybe angulata]|uniref:Major facilitator superfamily domain-containing protein n=1 Tax=Ephemerocybe angulata TaxID=980116 RepID=A0A8H6M3Q9_9AGAR|nr:major facilitator superfamily domain-containing protein [Tulosesus angulatus]